VAARGPGERIKISPVAKKMAQEHGIDIAALTGTGPEGRIVREDVERAIATKSREPRAESRVDREALADSIPLAGIRKVIFDRMGQSWREAARVTLFADADMSELVRLRQARLADWERRPGPFGTSRASTVGWMARPCGSARRSIWRLRLTSEKAWSPP
jgi:pyruvate dehydrogenase E2 component (dihydrolipoamide acetyltransferase)